MNSFHGEHPLHVRFHDTDHEPALVIADKGKGRAMILTIENRNDGQLTFDGAALNLRFRPDVIDMSEKPTVRSPAGWNLDAATSTWSITPPAAGMKQGESVHFTFKDLKGNGKAGVHGSRLELQYANVGVAAPDGKISKRTGFSQQHFAIVNHTGRKHVPLNMSIVGSRTILNGGLKNAGVKIVLRLLNTAVAGGHPQRLDLTGGKFQFAFEADDSEKGDKAWALGSVSQLDAIRATAKSSDGSPPQPRNVNAQGKEPMIELDFAAGMGLEPGGYIDIEFSDFVCSHPSGETHLQVSYEGIPGYWDGQATVVLEKAPLLFMTRDAWERGEILAAQPRVWVPGMVIGRELHFEAGAAISVDTDHSWGLANRRVMAFESNYQGDKARGLVHLFAPTNYETNVPAITLAGNYGPGGRVGINQPAPQATLDVRGPIHAGTSEIYFTDDSHSHSKFGNTKGYAAIENSADYGALMILGRAGTDKGRKVRLWDYLEIVGGLQIGSWVIKDNDGTLEFAHSNGNKVTFGADGRLSCAGRKAILHEDAVHIVLPNVGWLNKTVEGDSSHGPSHQGWAYWMFPADNDSNLRIDLIT